MSYRLIIKDAFWQILGRIFSALAGFVVIKLITPYLGPLRYGDYTTILKYFALWSALADFGIYVIALKKLGELKSNWDLLKEYLQKYVGARLALIIVVYTIALVVAYFIPSYSSNPFLVIGLPIGMIFSSLFMFAGISQLPLQLNWKMEHLSISLIWARIIQIISIGLIVYYLFPHPDFNTPNPYAIYAFLWILIATLLSALSQFLYVWYQSNKLINFRPNIDLTFIKNLIIQNWQYGLAFFLSSFHMLSVTILLSIFFPTVKGFNYVGIWALALALVEIVLIIPTALGNSLLHKIGSYTKEHKRKILGNFLIISVWIGLAIFLNYWLFAPLWIKVISGHKYLSVFLNWIGSDTILPFLGIVLILSYIKQVFNYIFISFEKQNILLHVNLSGIILGLSIWTVLILKYNLFGGIITQILLELLFVGWWIFWAGKQKILPLVPNQYIKEILLLAALIMIWGILFTIQGWPYKFIDISFASIGILISTNLAYILFSFPFAKKWAKWLN